MEKVKELKIWYTDDSMTTLIGEDANNAALQLFAYSNTGYPYVDAIGMGRNRKKVDHSKHNMMALCWKHHRELHNGGQETFMIRNHVVGVLMNEEQFQKLNYKG